MSHLPIERERIIELPQIESTGLSDKLDVARASPGVIEADKHDIWEIHEANLHIQHACCRLDHGLQAMARPPKHYHRPRKLHQKLFALDNLRNMSCNLRS